MNFSLFATRPVFRERLEDGRQPPRLRSQPLGDIPGDPVQGGLGCFAAVKADQLNVVRPGEEIERALFEVALRSDIQIPASGITLRAVNTEGVEIPAHIIDLDCQRRVAVVALVVGHGQLLESVAQVALRRPVDVLEKGGGDVGPGRFREFPAGRPAAAAFPGPPPPLSWARTGCRPPKYRSRRTPPRQDSYSPFSDSWAIVISYPG